MTDLHGWITQQVDRVEAEARARLIGAAVVIAPDDGSKPITGTVTAVEQTTDGLQYTVQQYDAAPTTGLVEVQAATAVLRRCEADRRILARHRIDPDQNAFPAACEGCGTDEWGLPIAEDLSECPELLDLAHGITDEILATLDRPQPPEPPRRRTHQLGLGDILRSPTDVPPALRGPNWKADT
ncbi:hypothetical protein ABZ508_26600 [Streptomyces lavendulocolor]|uniref:Uncharacterized protein n=1 Tax=Streptomyces lavendulocolor TaxID=67316 RepID=A0ABV2WC93_9ACTN